MKKIDIVALALLSSTILFAVLWGLSRGSSKKLSQQNAVYRDVVAHARDRDKQWLAQVNILSAEKKQLEHTYGFQIDSLKDLLGKETKRWQDLLVVAARERRAVKVKVQYDTIQRTDTVYQTSLKEVYRREPFLFDYYDRWLSMQGQYQDDSLMINYTAFDSLSFLTTKKRGLSTVQVVSHNPHVEILSATAIEVQDRKLSRWMVGPQFGAHYVIGQGIRPYVGVGVGFNLLPR